MPPATVKANASSTPQNSEWEFSRIEFAGTMEGNATRRTTTFDDRVEIVYGPVEHYGDTVNPDSGLPERGGWMRSCDTLTITQRKIQETDEGYIELLADGNAELEGRDYHGRADQVTFDESKGLYTLSGKGNNKATIWRQKSSGGSNQGQNGQIISVNPAKRKILIDGADRSRRQPVSHSLVPREHPKFGCPAAAGWHVQQCERVATCESNSRL